MSSLFVKVCGISDPTTVKLAADAGADAVGFVVNAPSSPRHLTLTQAESLISSCPAGVKPVLVTRSASLEEATRLASQHPECLVQAHFPRRALAGEVRRALLGGAHLPLSRLVLPVDLDGLSYLRPEDERLRRTLERLAFVLLDCSEGRGLPLDVAAAKEVVRRLEPCRVVVAGGLGPENVARVVRDVKPHGVDASSALESAPGVKDPVRVAAFVQRAKGTVKPTTTNETRRKNH
ncbi:MAG: N-(5'-phosphoribosyl)anthranilate isomerase [Promethearchaeota archaeon]